MLTLSERQPISPDQETRAAAASGDFVRAANLGFVVIDRPRVSDELRAFAIRHFELQLVATQGELELYETRRSTR